MLANIFSGPESPGLMFYNEGQLHASLDSHLVRYLRQYLRITFETFGRQARDLNASAITVRDGNFMRQVRGNKPDFGVYKQSVRGSFAINNR